MKRKKNGRIDYIVTFECKLAMFMVGVIMVYFFAVTFLPIQPASEKFVGTITGIFIYAIKDILIWAFKTAKLEKEKNHMRRKEDTE